MKPSVRITSPVVDRETFDSVRGSRGAVYGDPYYNHAGIACQWAPLLKEWAQDIHEGCPLPPHVVALLLTSLKVNRCRLPGVFHEDNYTDMAIYAGMARDWQRRHAEEYPRRTLRLYVAGPFSADSEEKIRENVDNASRAGLDLMRMGVLAHVPHTATRDWHGELDYEAFMDLDLSIIRSTWCDGLYYLGDSPGALRERDAAEMAGKPIFTSLPQVREFCAASRVYTACKECEP